ncbi:uncharacterized protein PV06_09266 [Exophiala oligosperma]|uniref:Uncharacterized protein n=1 Tax=Exophiala oligosperma TaxID=215243 RepID=A0A0D2DRB7_9EURO|nr:uncharacterized protein PV06_09266 [Exophiala oligosperma]KIW38289.1 hypothetical protein PV06_09266 [Exophiala oligosperma]
MANRAVATEPRVQDPGRMVSRPRRLGPGELDPAPPHERPGMVGGGGPRPLRQRQEGHPKPQSPCDSQDEGGLRAETNRIAGRRVTLDDNYDDVPRSVWPSASYNDVELFVGLLLPLFFPPTTSIEQAFRERSLCCMALSFHKMHTLGSIIYDIFSGVSIGRIPHFLVWPATRYIYLAMTGRHDSVERAVCHIVVIMRILSCLSVSCTYHLYLKGEETTIHQSRNASARP